MVFVNLKKSYDRVPKKVLCRGSEEKSVPMMYVKIHLDMFEEERTSYKNVCGGN